MHHGINAEIVCHGRENDVAQAERIRNKRGNVGVGNVADDDVLHAALVEAGGESLRGFLGVAVHGGVGNEHAPVLGLVAAPEIVLFNKIGKVLAPHGTVQRADEFDLVKQTGGFLQQRLHLRAVLAHDVCEVAAGVVDPVAVKVNLVREESAVKRAERTERVSGEENAVRRVERNEHLRPVHHRSRQEGQGVSAEGQGRALLDLHALVALGREAELTHHRERLRGGNHLHAGIAQQNLLHGSAVVGLHVVNHEVIERAARQHVIEVLQQLAARRPVHRIKQHRLLVRQDVRVVRNPARNRVDVLKESQPVIVRTDPVKILRNLAHIIHGKQSSLRAVPGTPGAPFL